MTAFHPHVLPKSQQEVLSAIAPFCTERGFYLGGGTAVAIHLGHRRSLDFDWFTGRDSFDAYELIAGLGDRGFAVEVTDIGQGSLHLVFRGIRITFLRYRYPLLRGLVDWPQYGCRLASLEDLACMKLAAVTSRGEKKDFFDIAAICVEALPLRSALELYQRKFSMTDIGHVLMSLNYFDDAMDDPPPELLVDITWEGVMKNIKSWILELAQ